MPWAASNSRSGSSARPAGLANVFPAFSFAPGGDRIDLLDAGGGVDLALGQLGAARRVLAALPGEPCPLAGERPGQWFDFTYFAAALAQLDAFIEGVAA